MSNMINLVTRVTAIVAGSVLAALVSVNGTVSAPESAAAAPTAPVAGQDTRSHNPTVMAPVIAEYLADDESDVFVGLAAPVDVEEAALAAVLADGSAWASPTDGAEAIYMHVGTVREWHTATDSGLIGMSADGVCICIDGAGEACLVGDYLTDGMLGVESGGRYEL